MILVCFSKNEVFKLKKPITPKNILSFTPLLGILLKYLIPINKYQRFYLIDSELSFSYVQRNPK